MEPLVWAGLLLLVGLMLAATEVFVPSGGILGFLSISSIIAGIVMAFVNGGAMAGGIFTLVAMVGLPSIMGGALYYLPRTAMGRKLLPTAPTSEEVMPDNEKFRELKSLLGKLGTAKSMMLPSGAVQIEGRTFDAFSEGMPIEPGQTVRVIEVRGTRVMVRPDDGRPSIAAGKKKDADRSPADDVLSQSIDTLGLDPFEDPLR